jgi:hypothetical protein
MAATAAGRWFLRRITNRSVDAATNELAEKLPDQVVKAADALPGDVMRAGGATLAAGRVAAKGIGAANNRARDRAQRNVDAFRAEVAVETELAKRSLWSDFLRFSGRADDATDALLDLRATVHPKSEPGSAFLRVPPPVFAGRRRGRQPRPDKVKRVKRSYLRPINPWD